jgi:hypothetical protein
VALLGDAGDLVEGGGGGRRTRPAAGAMAGSRPEAEAVTRSMGTGELLICSVATLAAVRSMRALLVGARFEPLEAPAS